MDNVSRATESLVETHGKNAARVAAQRALNAELGGSREAAQIWRQIAAAIQEMRKGEEERALRRDAGATDRLN